MSSLDRKFWSLFKKGVFEGNLTVTGAFTGTGGVVLATNSMFVGVAGVSAALAIAAQSLPMRAAGAIVDTVIAEARVLGRITGGNLGAIQILNEHIDAAAAIALTKINWLPGIVMGAVTGVALSIAPVAAAAGLKIHTHLATGAVYDYANEFKGESIKTSGFYDGLALDYKLYGSGTSILRAIRATVELGSGYSMTGTDYATQSMLAGGVFSASVSGTLSGAGVTVAGVLGQIGSNNLGTLTTCKYMAAVWADWASLVELGTGSSAIILATVGEGAGAATVDYGLLMVTGGHVTTGLSMDGGYTYVPIRIGTKANTAGSGIILAGDTDDSGGIQLYADDGGVAAVGDVLSGLRSRYLLTVNQSGGKTQTALFGQIRTLGTGGSPLLFSSGGFRGAYIFNQVGVVTLSNSAEYVGINQATTLAGAVVAGTGTRFAGIDINISGAGAITNTSGLCAALLIRSSGTAKWPVGLQMENLGALVGVKLGSCTTGIDFSGTIVTGIVMNPAAMTNGLIIGTPNVAVGYGLRPNMTDSYTVGAPVSAYFDDGGVAITAWGEMFTVGMLYKTASEAQGQSGMPYTAFFYNDVQCAMNGQASCGWSTVMSSFCVSGNLAGFEVGVSAHHFSVDINSPATLAAETTLACISFGGNWYSAALSGKIAAMQIRATNQAWDYFAVFPLSTNGMFQDAAASGGALKYLKIFVDGVVATIAVQLGT